VAFDEYQFLRYFIPGSLFVIYATALALPIINTDTLFFLQSYPDVVIGIVGGAFAAGLAGLFEKAPNNV
jgi:hypothetical protein